MEFQYRDGQNQRTPSTLPFSTAACLSRNPLQGLEVVPGGFSGSVLTPSVFQTTMPYNAEDAFRRELEKAEIRREMIVWEVALARRRELEEEVKREIALERMTGFSLPEQVSVPINGGTQPQLPPHVDIKEPYTHKDLKVIILAKPDANDYGAKRKAAKAPIADNNERMQKKPKQEWICALCQITATSETHLIQHLQGRKHKTKETSK